MFSGYYEYKMQQYAAALPRLKTVAERGNSEAQSMVASIYQLGLGNAEVDTEAAIFWYERASAQGYSVASNNLATIYIIQGEREKAKRFNRLAREQGFSHSPSFR
ncbi:MAG: sel1 repeat family protein [Cyanobacteria bacterium J06628_6]